MKNPLALFVFLGAVAPAFAAVPHRCDAAWLVKARDAVSRGNIPSDPNHYLKIETIPGGTRPVIDEKSRPKVCDAEVWRFLLETEAGYGFGWRKTLGPQVGILLAVDALYFDAESRNTKVEEESTAALSELMRSTVLRQLEATDGYLDLTALSDDNKENEAWANSAEGSAVTAQLKSWRADAEATSVVDGPNGREFSYCIGGQSAKDDGIPVSDLFGSISYRATIAHTIAFDITYQITAEAQKALTAFRSRPDAGALP